MSAKKAVLVVSFGTAVAKTRVANIDILEREIALEFSGWEVRRAFTSGQVRTKINKEEGLKTDSTKEALQKLAAEGFDEVLVQSTHIIPGEEYERMLEEIKPFCQAGYFSSIKLGRPLLFYSGTELGQPDDYRIAVEALRTQLPEPCGRVVLMGHGTCHEADGCYDLLQNRIEAASLPVFTATVEGGRTFEAAVKWLEKTNAGQVTLMPFMLVAGDHVLNDMAGTQAGSWQSCLRSAGWRTLSYLHGLGENPAFRRIYAEHLRSAAPLTEQDAWNARRGRMKEAES